MFLVVLVRGALPCLPLEIVGVMLQPEPIVLKTKGKCDTEKLKKLQKPQISKALKTRKTRARSFHQEATVINN